MIFNMRLSRESCTIYNRAVIHLESINQAVWAALAEDIFILIRFCSVGRMRGATLSGKPSD